MSETGFLETSSKLMATIRKGLKLCREMQSELNEDFRAKRITHAEWEAETKEISKKMAFFSQQLDIFSERLEQMKKH